MAKRPKDPDLEIGSEGFVEEFCIKPRYDEDGVQVSSGIDRQGREHPDPVPLSAPIGISPPPDLMDTIRKMVHSELAQHILDEGGVETFEEAGDFDVDDDPLPPLTIHEAILQTPVPAPVPPSPVPAPPKDAAGTEGGVSSPPPGYSAPTPT